jgi:hypothetical protein
MRTLPEIPQTPLPKIHCDTENFIRSHGNLQESFKTGGEQ